MKLKDLYNTFFSSQRLIIKDITDCSWRTIYFKGEFLEKEKFIEFDDAEVLGISSTIIDDNDYIVIDVYIKGGE